MVLQPAPDAGRVARLLRQDQGRFAAGRGDELGVEQIGGNGVGQADLRSGHLDDFHLGHEAAQVGKERLRLGKGLFMGEQHPFIGDRDHIIVESAGRDRGLGLAGEEHAVGRQAMRARHRLTGFAMLARWERAAAFAIDKDLDPGRSCAVQSRMWLAAPSSPKGAGTGAWTLKAGSAKASRNCAVVAGHS